MVVGHAADPAAMVRLASAVVTIGGQGDPTSGRVQDKLGRTVIPPGYDYFPIQYPASIELDKSRDAALRILHTYLTVTGAAEPYLIVAGYSLGTMAAEQEKRNLQALDDDEAPSRDQLSFVMIASPFAGNGGIFPRFAGISIPFITAGMGAAQPSRYDTTYSAVMYDTYADFPAYFNPIALLNSVLSIRYGHPDAYYDPLDPTSSPRYVTAGPDNLAGGKDTYVLYYNPHLPLFGPLRELASVLGLSAFTEPLISAIEPLARIMVDMAYTDRVNANPATATPFSLITPPE
ncbi:MAG: PE-PPE domain-containing protein, partial [Mycobacterium sp.]